LVLDGYPAVMRQPIRSDLFRPAPTWRVRKLGRGLWPADSCRTAARWGGCRPFGGRPGCYRRSPTWRCAAPSRRSRWPCGCRYSSHLRRPAHTHGSAHRADLVARSSQAAPRQLARRVSS